MGVHTFPILLFQREGIDNDNGFKASNIRSGEPVSRKGECGGELANVFKSERQKAGTDRVCASIVFTSPIVRSGVDGGGSIGKQILHSKWCSGELLTGWCLTYLLWLVMATGIGFEDDCGGDGNNGKLW